jgi:hypothetical protein
MAGANKLIWRPWAVKKFPPPITSSVSFVAGWWGGVVLATTLSKHVFRLWQRTYIVPACEDVTRVKRRLLFDRVGVFTADIIFTLMFINKTKRNANTVPI